MATVIGSRRAAGNGMRRKSATHRESDMKFHASIVTPDGLVADKDGLDSDDWGRNGSNRKMIGDFKRVLRENLTDDPTHCGKFRAQFGDFRHVMEWQQVEPFSAMAKFYVQEELVAASFYLHEGRDKGTSLIR